MTEAIAISITEVKGSAPRGAGTRMLVTPKGQSGTIGGGALEWEATKIARSMLQSGQTKARRKFPLGPDLGQCCGGAVVLEFDSPRTEDWSPSFNPLWIWGAGHVGRALVQVMAPLEDRNITWVDINEARFPDWNETHVDPLVAVDPPLAVRHAPQNADHIIVTLSHDVDLRLCDALLHHGFHSAGVIGSATKWTRFGKRLRTMGHSAQTINQIICPIGDTKLGKHPQAIALGVATALLQSPAHIGGHDAP